MTSHRFWKGALWGVVATLFMTALMLMGLATGMSPMPKPIPAAIVGKLFGAGLPRPLHLGLAVGAHLGYGAFWGGVAALAFRQVTLAKGIALGVALWLLMQLAVLPFLGWGVFGVAVTPKIAVATLVLHLVYGAGFGALMDRGVATVAAETTT